MNTQKIIYTIVWILILNIAQANNLEKLLNEATDSNPDFLAKKSLLKQAELNYKSNFGSYLPSVNATLSQTETNTGDSNTNQAKASVNANLNLFNGFSDDATLKNAQLEVKIAEENLKQLNAELTYEIKKSYFNYLYYKELVSLTEKIVERRLNQAELIKLKYEGGREDKGSYLQANVKYEEAKNEFNQAKRRLEIEKENLKFLIGDNKNIGSIDDEKLSKYSEVEFSFPNIEELVRKTPKYLVSSYTIESSKNDITIADSSFSPKLDLSTTLTKSGTSFNELEDKSISAGLTLTIPIFEGSTRYYKSQVAREAKNENFLNLRKVYNDVYYSILEAINSYKINLEQSRIQNEFLKASSLRAEVATTQYKNGLLNYTNWDSIQNELIENEKKNISIVKDVLVSKAEIESSLGQGSLK